ncbi:MAG: YebC/PmpR family DNA-binding transcriptional regulator [Thermoleophilia bacterium]|nr:YebC/PmpR family DNA-binding transcriptional regulator [Thermoleophilia bacterium]
MSGHSKWSSIKHKKGVADARRGQLFSKLSRAIIVAARDGGPDPDGNIALANAIEKARENSMPKDTIERAIARGSGTGGDGQAYERITYEGYAPGGVALLVEAVTDNRNRTASEVRHLFSKHDGNLGASGAVSWLFERKGVVLVDSTAVDEDELMLAAAEGGADDVEREGSSFRVVSGQEALPAVRAALDAAGIAYESAGVTMLAKTTVEIEEEATAKKVLRLMDALEENDDVQDVYANFDIPERVLETVAP